MAFMGFKAYPTPIWKPLGPFIIASGIVFWGVSALQNSMIRSPENAKDPRNPYAQKVQKEQHH